MATASRLFTLVVHFTSVFGQLTNECNSDEWQCSITGQCIPSDYVCDEIIDDCLDLSDSWASNCNECQDMPDFIKCKSPENEVEMCLLKDFFVCDGWRNCMDWSDEKDCDCEALGLFRCHSDGACSQRNCIGDMVTDCQDSSDEMVSSCPESTFKSCGLKGIEVVINDHLICDGESHCDDLWDEDPSTCDDCAADNLFRCADGERCVSTDQICDGTLNCRDLSDEVSDECDHCNKPGYIPCPEMPEYCFPEEQLCDGRPQCPNWGDELVEVCADQQGNCGREGVFTCLDKSFCVAETSTTLVDVDLGLAASREQKMTCDGLTNCRDRSDERSERCDCASDLLMRRCGELENDCVRQDLLCSATSKERHLCPNGWDMSPEICNGTCYLRFPGLKDDLHQPCDNGEKCINVVSWCDGIVDCEDGSDEGDCSFLVSLHWIWPLAFALLIVIVAFTIYAVLVRFARQATLCKSNQASISVPQFMCTPVFLDLPKMDLKEIENFFVEVHIEKLIHNHTESFLVLFLETLEIMRIHPAKLYEILHTLEEQSKDFGKGKGFEDRVKAVLGVHRLTMFCVEGLQEASRKYAVKAIVYNLKEKLKSLEMSLAVNKVGQLAVAFLENIYLLVSTTSFALDVVKDIFFFLILNETLNHVRTNSETLANSPAEFFFCYGIIGCIVTSHLATGIYCLIHRHKLMPHNLGGIRKAIFNILLILNFPFLPLFLHFRLSTLRIQMFEMRKKFEESKNLAAFILEKVDLEIEIETLHQLKTNVKLLEATLESIPQIIFIVSFLSFLQFSYFVHGRRYSYSFGVAKTIMGNDINTTIIFILGTLMSLISSIKAFARQTHFFKKRSLNISRKISLIIFYFLSLMARTCAIVTTTTLPALMNSDFMQAGPLPFDATDFLNMIQFRNQFLAFYSTNSSEHYSGRRFEDISNQIKINAIILAGGFVAHLLIYLFHALLTVPAFRRAKFQRKLFNVTVNIFLSVPFRDPKEIDYDQDAAQEWFLVILHPIENAIAMLYAIAYYNNKTYFNYQQLDKFALFFLLPVVLLNLISIFFFWFYKEHSSLLGDFHLAEQTQPQFTSEVIPGQFCLFLIFCDRASQDMILSVLEGNLANDSSNPGKDKSFLEILKNISISLETPVIAK